MVVAGEGTFIWDGAINSVMHILLQNFSHKINFHNFIHNLHLLGLTVVISSGLLLSANS